MNWSDWKDIASSLSAASPLLLIVAVAVMSRYFPTHEQLKQLLTGLVDKIAIAERTSQQTVERLNSFEQRLQSQSERLNRGDGRFEMLEHRLSALPTSDAITDLRVAMERLGAEIRVAAERHEGLEELLKATRNQIAMIDEHLRVKQK